MPTTERRRHQRVAIDCEMAVKIGEDFIACTLRNLSEGGILAHHEGTSNRQIAAGDKGTCWLAKGDDVFEVGFYVARVEGNQFAIIFDDLHDSQLLFIRRLIEAHEA